MAQEVGSWDFQIEPIRKAKNERPAPKLQTIQERFVAFHVGNPNIYVTLCEYARKAKAKGFTQIGIALIWEHMRYSEYVPGGKDLYKLSNDYRSRYARLVMQMEPDLQNFFKIRELETE